MKTSYVPTLLAFSLALSHCKSTSSTSRSLAQEMEIESPQILFDVNDVSLLMPSPKNQKTLNGYITFSDKTAEGVILSKELFAQAIKLGDISDKIPYDSFAVSGIRIDNCAKLLIQLPCTVQMRLVFQNTGKQEEGLVFDDQTIHLPFNVEGPHAIELYKDFLELKASALPESTKGKLDVHPILLKEGMQGKFAKKLKAIVAKYALQSKIERIAVMGTLTKGNNGTWTFGASQPVKDGKIVPSPVPCQGGELKNIFSSLTIFGPIPSMPASFRGNPKPDVVDCGNLDATPVIKETRRGTIHLEGEEKTTAINNALAINDPSKVFFASTTCVNCHLAGRRLEFTLGKEFLTADDGNPLRFQAPDDVTAIYEEQLSTAGNSWNMRAFGWNELGENPAITLYTFNDSMRVAHELNDLIRAGKLK